MGRTLRLLLDTHVLLWWWNDDPRLGADRRALIADPGSQLVVSAVTAWEIATKVRIRKLPELSMSVQEVLPAIASQGMNLLAIEPAHAIRAGSYDAVHADPFDRILAAQSELESLPLVTRDPAFANFPCETRW